PEDRRQRLKVLQRMHAHSQYCMSGDNTLQGVREGVRALAAMPDADEHFLVVLSDANLRRYGIRPSELAAALTSDPRVNAFVIFVASFGDEAAQLIRQLPAEHAFLCQDVAGLPHLFRSIFTANVV